MKKISLLYPLLLAVIMPILFHKQQAGINVLILDLIILALLLQSGRLILKTGMSIILPIGVVLSGLMVVIYGSATALCVNIISLILLNGWVAYPSMSVLMNGSIASVAVVFTAPFNYFNNLFKTFNANKSIRKMIRFSGFIIVPLILLIIFISIYSAASPYFERLTGGIMKYLEEAIMLISSSISAEVFWIGMAGLFMGFVLFYGILSSFFDLPGETGSDNLFRIKKNHWGSFIALKSEARTGVLIFVVLNLVLLLMNLLDFYYVWLFFEWDGGFLKQFVHEGTWLLIMSIVISMGLVLWFFRGNLNFYKGNGLLIGLSKLWIAQNLFLALSVGIRNFWYLHYFNLAYKRIWVFAFLILVVIGLITVFIKVKHRKSLRYLLIQNSIFAYIVFVGLSMINWDVLIARFNVNRAEEAFFHTNFMVQLEGTALPILIMDEQRLGQIADAQKDKFGFEVDYLPFDKYNQRLQQRKQNYLNGYPGLHWLGWNLAGYQTYRKLNK